MPGAGEVGVHVHVEAEVVLWSKDHAFVAGKDEVSDDAFDSLFV